MIRVPPLVLGAPRRVYSLTVGKPPSLNIVGYTILGGGGGSMSPDTLLKGLNFDRFTCDTTGTDPFDITLNMSGSGASQFLFKNMYIQDGTGAFRVYRSVDAVYDPAFNKWDWGNGSNLVWALADVGEVKTVIFTF